MGNVNVNIDGQKIRARAGSTILEAATANGITIPTLCHIKGQVPSGVCQVCVVEVEGSKTMMGACHTPVADGMAIHSKSPRVVAVRKVIVELLLTAHSGDCVNDTNAENCVLSIGYRGFKSKVVSGFDQAPAMMINDKIYGNLTPPVIAEILKSYA
jgi:NADH dehydrogenase/NADH:ubiquinone oxidoreductase subunit G